jgi:hypothetical protein
VHRQVVAPVLVVDSQVGCQADSQAACLAVVLRVSLVAWRVEQSQE